MSVRRDLRDTPGKFIGEKKGNILNSFEPGMGGIIIKRKRPSFLFLLVILISPLLANYPYFRAVQKTAKAYRVEASVEQMKLVPDDQGGQSFHITLKSNRNNFELVMLVGYIAAGEAMGTGVEPSEIYVTVDVPLGEGFRLLTMAKTDDVKKLLSGEINTAQFARIITYI